MISLPPLLLPVLLTLLAIDSLLEVGFIGSTVSYLHIAHHDVPFQIAATPSTEQVGLYAKPKHLLVNQGHTSNGAAGTALILVSLLGALVLWLERRHTLSSNPAYTTVQQSASPHVPGLNELTSYPPPPPTKTKTKGFNLAWLHPTWVVFTVLSFLLTFSALIYTFVATNQTKHSIIDLRIADATWRAATESTDVIAFPYPSDTWTPETWYRAVLGLEFVDESQKGNIRSHLHAMEGWRWNLIFLFLLGLAVMGVAVLGWAERRRGAGGKEYGSRRRGVGEKRISTVSEL